MKKSIIVPEKMLITRLKKTRQWWLWMLLMTVLVPVTARSQIPGTKQIMEEFPGFSEEFEGEREDMIDFVYSRTVALSVHTSYNVLVGNLSDTQDHDFSVSGSLTYFIRTQFAVVIKGGYSQADLTVDGVQSYTDTYGNAQLARLKYTGMVRMIPATVGFRYYFGHPAHPNLLTWSGIHFGVAGGVLIREETKDKDGLITGPNHPGITPLKDISPIVHFYGGFEVPLLDTGFHIGVNVGYLLAFLSDENEVDEVGNERDGDWFTVSGYLMAQL